MFHVKTLGELRQSRDAGEPHPLRRKPLALVAYLARHAPRAVTRTELATLFWGERGEDRARQSLRQALLEVKQVLGDGIDVDTETVRLADGAVALDIVAFEQDVAAGRVSEAADRWTGEFFEGAEDIGGDGFRRWIENERAGLHRQLGVAMEKLLGDAELRGDWTEAVLRARRWAGALPFEETPHLRLIEALRMQGNSAEALKVHAGFVSRIRAAHDVEPSDEFLRLGGGLADDARTELSRKSRGSAAVHEPQLVGRTAIVGELVDAWRQAVAGSPSVALVRGESGSGLTRACDELVERAGADLLLLRTRGVPDGAWGTATALCEGLRRAAGLAGASPEALAETARLVPTLAGQFPHLPAATGQDAALRDGLSQVLAATAEEHPVLLMVDDLERADEPSKRLITALAGRLNGAVMLLITDREESPLSGEPLAALLAAKGLRRLQLSALGLAEVEAMLGSMVTMQPEDRHALAGRLLEESSGLPHHIRELVSSLVDDHLLTLDASGAWTVSPALAGRPLPLPNSVRDRVRDRLQRESAAARALSEALAVLGGPAELTVAGSVAGLSPDDAETAVAELITDRLVRRTHPGAAQIAFASPLIARSAAALLPPTRRAALHARAAQVLSEHDLTSTAERSLLPYHLARSESALAPPSEPARRRVPTWLVLAFAMLAGVGIGGFLWARKGRMAESGVGAVPVIALGRITDYRPGAPNDLTRPLTDMLATNLGRVAGLRVVSNARMYELVSHGGSQAVDTTSAALVRAARHAGATELIDGALYARDDGGFRLDLRRIELATGNIQQTHSVAGGTVFELADSGTARLASDFGGSGPIGSIADVTTRSLPAYRLYEEGLRAYYAFDLRVAHDLFESALREDSTFAMAAYYSALSSTDNARIALSRYELASRLALRIPDRERLTILAGYAFSASSPTQRALADTLVMKYPDEVEGYFYRGLSLMVEGRFLESLPLYNRVIAMDSLSLGADRPGCEACDALRQIVSVYQLADSLPAAERAARRWMRLVPRSTAARFVLAEVLSQQDRMNEALAVLDEAGTIGEGRREEQRLIDRAVHSIYGADYAQADRLLTGEIESGNPFRRQAALWYLAISLRHQGRLDEALAASRRHTAIAMERYPRDIRARQASAPPEELAEGETLFEMGRYRAAAAVFDSISRWKVGDESETHLAHARVWALTHAARSRAAAGDTVGLMALADTLEVLGPKSALGRDHVLHFYVRGLVQAARGDHAAAVESFRAALWSSSFGYTRINVAMAQSLLMLGRPREAVAVLRSSLRGSLEASNFYLTRTEGHELLAQAWDAVGGPGSRDSALVHYRVVARAWTRADAALAERKRAVEARINALSAR